MLNYFFYKLYIYNLYMSEKVKREFLNIENLGNVGESIAPDFKKNLKI